MSEARLAIETDRLTLQPYSAGQLLALIEHPERFEELAGCPAADGLRAFLVSGDVSPTFLAALRASRGPDPWVYGFAVVHRDRRVVIGNASFKGPPDEAGIVEVAYGIVPGFEGRGFATEAVTAVVTFAFASGLVRLIRAHTLPASSASTHVLAKCGFHFVGDVVDPDDGPVWRWERAATPMAQVRPATLADSAAWLRMRCALWPEASESWHGSEIAAFFAGELHMPLGVLVATNGSGDTVGFAELSIRPYAEDCLTDRVAYLEGWYVVPDARRQGVGRALVRAAEQWATAQGCTEFASDALIDNEISAAAHRALGFTETVRIRCFRKVLSSS